MAIVTVGGPPGSGTSTVCKLLAEKTGYEYIYAGQLFRNSAKERNLTLSEFSELCEEDPSVDRELDSRMVYLAREGKNRILEGRMTGPLCRKEDIDSLKVYIDADPRTRAERVMERDGGEIEEVMTLMNDREASEARRYVDYYGLDPRDHSHYDLIIDSSSIIPDEEVDIILKEMEGNY